MNPAAEIGFVGLGVMGESMCRNLALKSGRTVIAYDLDPEPPGRLAADGVKPATSLDEIAAVILLSLPGKVKRAAPGWLATRCGAPAPPAGAGSIFQHWCD